MALAFYAQAWYNISMAQTSAWHKTKARRLAERNAQLGILPMRHFGFNEKGQPVCNARNKQGGGRLGGSTKEEGGNGSGNEYCQRVDIQANGRCPVHGGLTPSGQDSHAFVDGRFSKHMPTNLREKYIEMQEDQNRVQLRDFICINAARMAELLQGLSEDSFRGSIWARLSSTIGPLRRMLDDKRDRNKPLDNEVIVPMLEKLIKTLDDGQRDNQAWMEIYSVGELIRRQIETEGKLLAVGQMMLNAGQAMLLVEALKSSVRTHVKDPEARRAIAADLRSFMAVSADKLDGVSDIKLQGPVGPQQYDDVGDPIHPPGLIVINKETGGVQEY